MDISIKAMQATATPVATPSTAGVCPIDTVFVFDVTLGKLPSGETVYIVGSGKSAKIAEGFRAGLEQYVDKVQIVWSATGGMLAQNSTKNEYDNDWTAPRNTSGSVQNFQISTKASIPGYDNSACMVINMQVLAEPVATPTPIVAPTPSLSPKPLRRDGDVNSDNKFELVDMSALLTVFDAGKNGVISEADLNADGVVNSFDFIKERTILLEKRVIKESNVVIKDGIMVTMSCSGGTLTASVVGNLPSPADRNNGIWGTLTADKTNERMIYGFSGNQGTTTNLTANFPPTGPIRSGATVSVVGDGSVYTVKFYAAPYTEGMPSLVTPVAQASFSKQCRAIYKVNFVLVFSVFL